MMRETGGAAVSETNGVGVVEAAGAAVCDAVGAAFGLPVELLFSACEQLVTKPAKSIEAVTVYNAAVLITMKATYLTQAGTVQLSPSVSNTPSSSSSR